MKMKKFLNDPDNIVRELLEGLYYSNMDKLDLLPNNLVVSKQMGDRQRVHIVTLGGTGHEPGLIGFVGQGMIDICAPGDIFAAPGPDLCFEAISRAHEASRGEGVLFIVLNHSGDMMTANLAMEMVEAEGLKVQKVVTKDDVSVSGQQREERRGLVGCVPLFKLCGAAAAAGKSLDEVSRIAEKFLSNMATVTVASRGATHPQTGAQIAVFADNEMEIGMGQHGEDSGQRMGLKSADETAEILLARLLEHISFKFGDKALVLLSGSGSTTLMELLIVFRHVHALLEEKGFGVGAQWVGEIMTVQEASGFQLCVAAMDDELLSYWNMECNTPYYRV